MPVTASFWQLSFGKRPREELFDVKHDPECMKNLAESPAYRKQKAELKQQLFDELKAQQDPRMFGRGNIFDEYTYSDARTRNFYERYMKGEKIRAGWVNDSDFEKKPLD